MPLNYSLGTDKGAAEMGIVGASGGALTFDFTGASTIAAGVESSDLVAAPGAGNFVQVVWFDFVGSCAAALNMGLLLEPSGASGLIMKVRTATATLNDYRPALYFNVNTNKAFRIKNLDGASALSIVLSFQYRILVA